MLLNRIALAGLLFGVAGVGACTTLRRVQPAEYFARNSPEVVWVTHTNNTVVPVAQPEIAGDTLKGIWQGTQRPVAIPLDKVRSVQAKARDDMKTAVLLTTLGVAFASSVYFMWISKAGPNPSGVYCGVYETARDGPSGAPRPYC
jgi:hypothetical protein